MKTVLLGISISAALFLIWVLEPKLGVTLLCLFPFYAGSLVRRFVK